MQFKPITSQIKKNGQGGLIDNFLRFAEVSLFILTVLLQQVYGNRTDSSPLIFSVLQLCQRLSKKQQILCDVKLEEDKDEEAELFRCDVVCVPKQSDKAVFISECLSWHW